MFRRKICPITRSPDHKFDPTTHRCGCGQWERGYKPAQEPVRPRAECQICCRQQAITANGTLGHHGYTRPGCGWIKGDCMGVGYQPYPKTDALELYKKAVESHVARCEARLAEVPNLDHIVYRWTIKYGNKKGDYEVRVNRGDCYIYHKETSYGVPSFEQLQSEMRRNLEFEVRHGNAEIARVVKRIEDAKS